MAKKTSISLLLLIILSATSIFAESITFTFDNFQLTGTSPKYYEFDVMAQGGTGTTKIGGTMVYINYNTTAFGLSIASNSKITATKETLLLGETPPFGEHYSIVNITDNTTSRVAITVDYNFAGSGVGNNLPASPTKLIHVNIEIADQGATSGLSFQQSLMEGEEYQEDNSTKYDPVTASDTDNSALPVQMTGFIATSDQESGSITVTWQTEQEIGIVGYHVWRSKNEIKNYEKITASLIRGIPDNLSAHEYIFSDKNISHGVTYWYKIETISVDGSSEFFGPVSAEGLLPVPEEFGLSQNYPNPFNPETTIEYQLPEDSKVTIRIFNILGKQIRELVDENKQAGYLNVIWDGKNFHNNDVSSGIYLIQMQAGKFNEVRKATVLR